MTSEAPQPQQDNARRCRKFFVSPEATKWGFDSPATLLARLLRDYEGAKTRKKKWSIAAGTDGRITFKTGNDFRTGAPFLLVRFDGRMIVRLWPSPGQSRTWVEDALNRGVVNESGNRVLDLIQTVSGSWEAAAYGTPRGKRLLDTDPTPDEIVQAIRNIGGFVY